MALTRLTMMTLDSDFKDYVAIRHLAPVQHCQASPLNRVSSER